jgi:hypothetical protein
VPSFISFANILNLLNIYIQVLQKFSVPVNNKYRPLDNDIRLFLSMDENSVLHMVAEVQKTKVQKELTIQVRKIFATIIVMLSWISGSPKCHQYSS